VSAGDPIHLSGEPHGVEGDRDLEDRSTNTAQMKPSPQRSWTQSRRVMDYIHANLDCELSINILANLGQLSPRQFFRRFLNTFGTTPHRYVIEERLAHAKELLLSGQPLGEIAATVGFASQSHFNDVFRKATGMPPNRFRQEHWSRGQDCCCNQRKQTSIAIDNLLKRLAR
jgi:AraC-like DNA-binding protein